MGAYRQSSLRALAPASLVAFAIIFLIVVIASLSGGGGGDSSSTSVDRVTVTEPQKRNRAQERAKRARRLARRGIYVVRTGDNLFTIANKTGVPIETLRELNPTADPQDLATGQHIRLPVKGERGATGPTGATGTTGASVPG
jgi:LysM repeat protein